MQFDKGFLSPYFITDTKDLSCVLEDAYVLLHEKKLSNLRDLIPAARERRPRGQARSSSWPRTSRASASRRSSSTGCAAR